MSSLDDLKSKSYGRLIDTYGNEFELPDYTINDIRNAIPKHCYERSALRGLYYVFRDIASLATTFYICNRFVTPHYVPSTAVRALLWALYTVIQGFFATGLWVLAHECGHQSFSPSKVLNDTVGWICHSALLVPYFSWKISHGKHHKATGNIERDMVHVPKTREAYATRIGKLAHELTELTEETPIFTALHLVGQQLAGWFIYISTNATGHDNHERQLEGRGKGKKNGFFGGVNHFDPSSPLYEAKDAKLVLLSDLGLGIAVSILVMLGRTYGWNNMAVWYFIPYLWVNHWLGKLFPFPPIPDSDAPQLRSPTSSTPIQPFLTTLAHLGTTFVAPLRQLIVNSDLSVANFSMVLSRLTCSTTTSARFLSTTRMRPLRLLSQSWDVTIALMSTVAP